MTQKTRIEPLSPKRAGLLTRAMYRVARRRYGQVPEPFTVAARHRKLMVPGAAHETMVDRASVTVSGHRSQYPPTPTRPIHAGLNLHRPQYRLGDGQLRTRRPAGIDPADPGLSPQHGEVAGLPPAYSATVGFDPVRDDGEASADRPRADGLPVALACQADLPVRVGDIPWRADLPVADRDRPDPPRRHAAVMFSRTHPDFSGPAGFRRCRSD